MPVSISKLSLVSELTFKMRIFTITMGQIMQPAAFIALTSRTENIVKQETQRIAKKTRVNRVGFILLATWHAFWLREKVYSGYERKCMLESRENEDDDVIHILQWHTADVPCNLLICSICRSAVCTASLHNLHSQFAQPVCTIC